MALALVDRLQASSADLHARAVARMEADLDWFAALPARDRAAVGQLAQQGVRTFIDWLRGQADEARITEQVFTSAPRQLAGTLTLEQTVQLVRTSMSVVYESIPTVTPEADEQQRLREALLRYSSEVAFAAANVYARLAENRGAWDARVQAMVLESVMAGDSGATIVTRAAAAGWRTDGALFTLVGSAPTTRGALEVHAAQLQRTARSAGLDVLVGMHNDRMVAIVSGVAADGSLTEAARPLVGHFGAGPVVAGPLVADPADLPASAHAALSGYAAAGLTRTEHRLILPDEVIAARVLDGDPAAADPVVARLTDLRPDVLDTLAAFLEHSTTIEGCARTQFIHVNTVRYRLRQVANITGLDPMEPGDAFTLRIGLILGRKAGVL